MTDARELAVIDAETGELIQTPANLFGTADPHEVVVRAKAYADELAKIIQQRQLYRVIRGKAHVYVEAWTLLGSMLGVFPVVDEVEPVEIDGVRGFQAAVRAVTRDGAVVGRAVAYCLRDENMWSEHPVSKDGKPLEKRDLHALAAMAETRATSRALRKPLGFIVQLAGYSPTSAEEMPAGGGSGSYAVGVPAPLTEGGAAAAGSPPSVSAEPDVPDALQPGDPKATAPQKKKLDILVARMRERGTVTTEQLWLEAGYPTAIVDPERGEPRWGGEHGLRERLSKRTANRMIELLQDLETQNNIVVEESGQEALKVPDEVRRRMETGE